MTGRDALTALVYDPHASRHGRTFTSTTGCWWDLANWRRMYWEQAVAVVFANEPVLLAKFQFRKLSHASITCWILCERKTAREVAELAGNTERVIGQNYKGVIDEAE